MTRRLSSRNALRPAACAAALLLASPWALAQATTGSSTSSTSSGKPAASRTVRPPATKPAAALPPAPMAAAAEARVAAATAWQKCVAMDASNARLACFDQWAIEQQKLVQAVQERTAEVTSQPSSNLPPSAGASAVRADVAAALATAQPATDPNVTTATGSVGIVGVGLEQGCRDRQFSDTSRFWELESGSSCPTFSFRGYRANTLSIAAGSSVNRMPTSDNPNNNATTSEDYSKQEVRLQLSVRTKVASGLLTPANSPLRDSLWFAYSQQSYWQFFNSGLSRPFRSTDYEPEAIYVYPTDAQLPFGWRWRYSGAGLVHQSNGQSDPLSRSWNRFYLMTGFEKGNDFTVSARIWKRLSESATDDNNPRITDYIGRGEVSASWNADRYNTFVGTLRGSLNGNGHGSARLEWLRSLADGMGNSYSGLRLHTQLFTGYGDSLIDYNRKRTVLTVGFSIVDF